MAVVREFRGIRPAPGKGHIVSELPYDVLDDHEVREIVANNPESFYRISRAEVDFEPGVDAYGDAVYAKGRDNLQGFIDAGSMIEESEPSFYLYTLEMQGRRQTGLLSCVSVDDYLEDRIKKHELTREDKEQDRIRHLDTLNANTGLVFLLFNDDGRGKALLQKETGGEALYDFIAEDGIRHSIHRIDDAATGAELKKLLAPMDLYIADGHHRAASAARVAEMRRNDTPGWNGSEEFNYFLSVIFPHDELFVMAYNRVVKDLQGRSTDEFLKELEKSFTIEKEGPAEPKEGGEFSCYIEGAWYTLKPRQAVLGDAVARLDVSVLQERVLSPILGIENPRNDSRIKFIGGIRGTEELERLVDSGDFAVAFSLYPTAVEQLIEVSDQGSLMPPKSTWFEPKLRSGLMVHRIDR